MLGPEETVTGQIFIGAAESEQLRSLMRAAAQLRREYPGIHFRMTVGDSKDLLERLDRGLLDFALLRHPADPGRYDLRELSQRDRWGLLMRADCPLAAAEEILPEQLKTVPILLSRQAEQDGLTDLWLHGEPLTDLAATFNLVSTGIMMVEEGLGCAIIPEHSAPTCEKGLQFRPITPVITTGLILVWKKYQMLSRPAELFLSRLGL